MPAPAGASRLARMGGHPSSWFNLQIETATHRIPEISIQESVCSKLIGSTDARSHAMNFQRVVLLISVCAPTVIAQSAALSAGARQIAGIIGITEIIDQFEAPGPSRLYRQHSPQTDPSAADHRGDSRNGPECGRGGSIQREQAQLEVTRNYLSAQRDRLVGLTTAAATITGSGIGIAGGGMQFSDRTAYAVDAVSVGSGAASTILSLLGLRLQRWGKAPIEVAPNMLARPFSRPSERLSAWPDDVWAYLNSVPPAGVRRETRLESLIEDWTRQGRISSQASPAAERKIEFLTSSFSERRWLSLNDLSDRYSMMADLRAQVALMKRDLADLAHYLRAAGW